MNASVQQPVRGTVVPTLRYRDVPAAIDWLCTAFGFEKHLVVAGDDGSVRYAQLIYDGLWFSTLREALAAFVDFTEQEVTGEVRVQLFKGRAVAVGRRSPRSLYRQDLATFGEDMAYDHADAGGFIRLFGLPERVRALTRERLGEKADRTVGGGRPGAREEIKR